MTGWGTLCDMGELVGGIGSKGSLKKGLMQIILNFGKV